MPWCETCQRFWNPPTLGPAGECPTCGRRLAAGAVAVDQPDRSPSAPWHFKVLVGAAAVYLLVRLWQGIAWLVDRV